MVVDNTTCMKNVDSQQVKDTDIYNYYNIIIKKIFEIRRGKTNS